MLRTPANRLLVSVLLLAGAIPTTPDVAGAQWSTAYEQFYLPGGFNWQFRHNYPAADRLFNAFDYGHAILYETLWNEPNAPISALEDKEYNFITRELLVHPPRVPLEEAAIEVAYAKLAPEAKLMFDWAHLFHRQVYDVWADERIPLADKDAKVAELLRYYKSRPDIAFSSQPKTMELMEGQPYSLAFRKNYPKFNGLIWAYHWLQVGLYEPLVVGKNKDERQTGVLAAVARFRQMIENPPTNMPRIMPMTAAVAPMFAARYPEASIIFDNLHSMHDVVSDILANPSVSRDRKREEIIRAARRYRDATSYVQSAAEWREMAQMMGVENMGGPAVNFLPTFPAPTVERGAVVAGMDHGKMNMPGMRDTTRARADSMPGMDHSRMSMPGRRDTTRVRPDSMSAMDHSKMNMPGARDASRAAADSMAGDAHAEHMMELHMRRMNDSVIRRRVVADTAMRRMMLDAINQMPAEHRAMMMEMMLSAAADTADAPPVAGARRSSKPTPSRTAPTTKPQPGHEGMNMPGMKMPTAPPKTSPKPTTPAAKKTAPSARDSMPGMDHSKMKMPAKP
jgi:hypothetical protein